MQDTFPDEVDALIAMRDNLLTACPVAMREGAGWTDLHLHRDHSRCDGIAIDEEGHVSVINLDAFTSKGTLPPLFSAFTSLKKCEISGHKEVVGPVPDFSHCSNLEVCNISGNDFNGVMPQSWPRALKTLRVHNNEHLSGSISTSLVLQCEHITYHNCKPNCMISPFIIGASVANEDSWSILNQKGYFNVSSDMLKDPPQIGDPQYPMTHTHGPTWVAWQDVWLYGLRGLHNREVFVLCGDENFRPQFVSNPTETENREKCFDPTYNMPDGEQARCILDWQRVQLEIESQRNNLRIVFTDPGWTRNDIDKPVWYC